MKARMPGGAWCWARWENCVPGLQMSQKWGCHHHEVVREVTSLQCEGPDKSSDAEILLPQGAVPGKKNSYPTQDPTGLPELNPQGDEVFGRFVYMEYSFLSCTPPLNCKTNYVKQLLTRCSWIPSDAEMWQLSVIEWSTCRHELDWLPAQ